MNRMKASELGFPDGWRQGK